MFVRKFNFHKFLRQNSSSFCSDLSESEKHFLKSSVYSSVQKSRNIISVRGPDATKFLQNLITQDMRIFSDDSIRAIPGLFLNPKGRILFDSILIKSYLLSFNQLRQ